MKFIIQKDEDFDDIDIELQALKNELKYSLGRHSYSQLSIKDPIPDEKNICPVGSIEFVSRFLGKNMSPIEVPKVLRRPEFLGREYKICSLKDIPNTGNYFVKDASVLKQPTYMGNTSYLDREELNPEHMFVVSQVVNIRAEYRVFVFNEKIQGIQFYNGYPDIMPTPEEINKIKKMISVYSSDSLRPKAYAMDVGIVFNEDNRDLVIIELCPFACLGTYGLYGSFLPYMYAEGFRWYLEHNTPIEI